MKTIANKKFIITALIFAGLTLLFLNTASPFLHNHDADAEQHDDCMVYHMEATLFQIILTVILAFWAILFPLLDTLVQQEKVLVQQAVTCSINNRAPPV